MIDINTSLHPWPLPLILIFQFFTWIVAYVILWHYIEYYIYIHMQFYHLENKINHNFYALCNSLLIHQLLGLTEYTRTLSL